MPRMKLFLSIACGLLLAPSAHAESLPDDAPRVWTWDTLVEEVERTSPLMKAAAQDLATFEAKASQANWAYFPSFKLDAGMTLTPSIRGDALSSETSYDTIGIFLSFKLDIVQPLFTSGKIEALQRAARRGLHVGRALREAARWELRYRLAQAFHGRLLARELAAILEDGRGWLTKAQDRMERQRDEDSADYDQMEHLRLKTRAADFYVLDTENALLDARATAGLRLLLSLPPGAEVVLAPGPLEPLAFTVLSADAYAALARRHHPMTVVAQRAAAAEEALADAKDAELWPDFVLVGQAGMTHANEIQNQASSFANDPYNGSSIGAALGMRWGLDVPQRMFKAEEARAKALKRHYQGQAQADMAELEVRGLVQKLANHKQLLGVFRRAQKAAQGWLTATWDTYDAGFGSFRDVMDALIQFYSKKFGYLQQVFEHNQTVAALSRAVGLDITALTPADAPTSDASADE